VAAAELAARGREVSVILLCERDSLQGDAASAARGWKYPVLPFNPQAIGRPALIIDALFGAGLNRPVKGEPHDMIDAINAMVRRFSALTCRAASMATPAPSWASRSAPPRLSPFFRRKPGHLLLPGRIHCGRAAPCRYRDHSAQCSTEIRPADFRKHSRNSGATRFRYRGLTAINTPAAMRWSSPASLLRPARLGWRRAARYELAPDW
jgi:hypothetical protein